MIPDLLRARRLRVCVVVVVMFAGFFVSTSAAAQKSPSAGKGATIEEIAQTLSSALRKSHVHRVVIVDFVAVNGAPTPPFEWMGGPGLFEAAEASGVVNFMGVVGQPTAFGTWLAERLSAAGGWAPIDVVDRKKLAAELSGLRSPDTNEFEPEKVKSLIRMQDVTLVTGSYTAADNGIGVTVASITWPKGVWSRKVCSTMRGKIELTEEIKENLPGPLETLGPSDGIFSAGQGGVTRPWCGDPYNGDLYALLGYSYASEREPKFPVEFSIVVNSDGRVSDMSRCKGAAVYCRYAVQTPERDRWQCRPALDIDGKAVSTRVLFRVIY